MADESSMSAYQKSGFGESDGVSGLQKTANSIATTDSKLKKEAIAQYKPTYELEQQSLTNQLSALIQSQSNDSELLNKSYQQSVNSMMAKLQQRGLGTDVHMDTTEAALHKFYNEVMDERNIAYGVQQSGIEARQKTLKENYNQNVLARMSQNKLNNLKNQTQILTKIADIQANSYQNYINYLLAEQQQKAASSVGGRRRYYGGYGRRYYGYGRGGRGGSGGSGAGEGSSAQPTGALDNGYFNNGSGGVGPGVINTLANAIKNTVRAGNRIMGGIADYVSKHRK